MDYSDHVTDRSLSIDKKVAIVGIGCRYPGDIKTPQEFWETIKQGIDCIGPHPPERLDPSYICHGDRIPGKIYTTAAGYLSQDVEEFDRELFKISPEEVHHMDPQLRHLLEVSWEAFEDYGVNMIELTKSATGVYIGVMTREYAILLALPDDNIGQYSASGNNSNMLSNRISYQFDLQGPSITFDTACSSSMYAIHHACEAIRHGECNLALAGGVNLLLLPSTTISLCQARMLSKDGKCKSFDNRADGYSRGEGVGLVVLKSLRRALDDGDRIYAVIRGGAINNNGRTNGIISPNIDAQISLLKRAYEIAKVVPQNVPYVEAHGTGTKAGDTTEANAIGRVLGIGRNEHNPPLIVGSVKSNFGHTEGAAGVASVIKVCLVLHKKQIPKVVHFNTRNENVQWRNFEITFPTNLLTWPENSNYIAGCSSFGFGGANAHLVLEASPDCKKIPPLRNDSKNNVYPTILFLSAASANALNQRLYDWVDFLKNMGDDIDTFDNALHTAARRATHQSHRLAVICESYQQTIDILEKRDDGHMFVEGRVETMYNNRTHQLAFVFSGMGTQWWAMGRQLMNTDAVFRNCIVEIDKLLIGFGAKWSLNYLLTVETDKEKIHSTDIAQPAICAIQISLAAVYRHLGIHPDVVIGHSVGEVAAAYVAGYMSLSDTIRLIYVRGKSLQKTSGNGKMAAILSPVQVVREVIREPKYEGRVDIACVNSPSQTVISGEGDDIDQVIQVLESQGIRCIKLSVKNAFHSFQQEEIKQYFLKHTQFLRRPKFRLGHKFTPIHVKMISTVNGQYLNDSILNTNTYWWNNIRQTVEFEDSLVRLFKGGCNVLLEIGPHPSLASPIKSTMVSFSEQSGVSFHEEFAVLPSLRRPSDITQEAADKVNILMSIAKLYIQGFPIQMNLIFHSERFCVMSIPKYPWQRQLYSAVTDTAKRAYINPRYYHPLLGEQILTFSETQQDHPHKEWTSNYNRLVCPWLHHHKIQNAIVLPGAAFIEIMLRAASSENGSPDVIQLKNIQFHKFHYSPNGEGVLYTSLSQIGPDNKNICIRTRNEIDNSWTLHATCDLDFSTETHTLIQQRYLDTDEVIGRCKRKLSSDILYKKLHEGGVQIGDMFASVTSAYYSATDQEALVFASLPMTIEKESQLYTFHPALLDSIFQLFAGFAVLKIDTFNSHGNVEVPKAVRSFRIIGKAPTDIVIHARKHSEGTHEVHKVRVSDQESGKIFAEIDGVVLATVGAKDDEGSIRWGKEWVPVDWEEDIPMLFEKSALLKNKEYFLIPDGQGVTEKLMTLLHTIDINIHVHVSDPTTDAHMPVSYASNVSSRHIVFMHMINECSSLSEIKRETFIDSQINKSISCIETTINTVAEHTENTYVWIVTKGAVLACPSDNTINPLMSNALALVLTFMHEHPDIYIAALDLPHDLPPNDCALWLSYFLKSPILSENCLALRLNNGSCKVNELNLKAYSLRLTTKPTSELVITKRSHQWMINLDDITQKGTGQYIKPWNENNIICKDDLGPTVSKHIVVEAYLQQPYKNLNDINRSRSGFLYAGKVSNFHSATDCKEATPAFVGYCRSHIVISVLKSNISNIVPLPLNVSPVDALSIIASCLPLYIAIKDSVQIVGQHVVLLTLSYDPLHVRLAKLLSESTSCKITLCVSDAENLNQRDNIISLDNLACELTSSTVDTLILHPDVKLDSKDVTIVLEKIRLFGKLVTFTSGQWKHPLILQQQIQMEMIDMEILRSDDHHKFMNSLVTSLLKLFFENGSNSDFSCDTPGDVVSINDANGNQLCGENVVWTNPAMPVEVSCRLTDFMSTFKANTNASYLVVGGTKGLGFEIVRWLARHGAKMIYFSGRSPPKEDIATEIKILNKSMHNLEFIKCDASEKNQTIKMLNRIKDCSTLPLKGIFHCAAAFVDQRLEDATYDDWHTVLFPKAYGALLLHQITQTLDIKLSEFVVLSSIVEFLGNEGQASYCCANAFLTSLCQARRLEGLPSTVIAPGAVSNVGFAAREGFVRLFEARGMNSVSPNEVIESLAWSNGTNEMMFGITGVLDKQLYVNANPMFERFVGKNHFSIFKKEFSRQLLDDITRNTQTTISPSEITNFFVGFVENRLGVTERVSTETSLGFYGLDSAMSWELSALIISTYNVGVSAVELLNESLKISDVANLVCDRANGSEENGVLGENIERVSTDTSTVWLQNLYQLENTNTDIICFPCTGKGTAMFEQWVEDFALDDICLTVTQLPGWEGRMTEKPSHNLEFLVQNISTCILANFQPNRVSFVGCGIGALLALEVALRLQTENEFRISHIFVIGWYPPSSTYPTEIVYGEQPKKQIVGKLNIEKRALKFLDNRDLKQVQMFRKAFLNVQASKAICTQYNRMTDCRLLCDMTVFTGSKDPILSKKLVDKWKDEIHADQIFQNVQLKADHKLFRNKKSNMKIASIIRNSLSEKPTVSRATSKLN